jgi:DnaK suppressor protein
MTTSKDNVSTITRKSALPVDGIEPYVPKEGQEYMNEEQTEHFRNILLQWKQSLMSEVDKTVDHMKSEVKHLSDPSDRATQEEEFAIELRTRDRERLLIAKIDKTLAMIDNDEYGYCDACGVEIGLQRLEVRPTAELCIDCKTTQEIKERQLA